jgi:hypothetical protein
LAGVREKVCLKVVHGHLAFAKHPVLVGHYNGDTFAGAEAQLDQVLDKRLSQRRRLGLYPGPLGTNTVVLDTAQKPPGAVVVGLGEAASLSLGGLRRTIRQGILALAAAETDVRKAVPKTMGAVEADADAQIGLSTLLVGSGDGGLDRTTCVTALVQAVAEAQSVFTATADLSATLVSVEILEVFEHRAFAIWQSINRAIHTQSDLAEYFALEKEIETRAGGRRRIGTGRDHSWWEPIQITMSKDEDGRGNLIFTAPSGLARAEMRTIAADLDVVEPLMRQAIRGDALDGPKASPGRALFELLWPSSLKDQSSDERNRRLVLDEESAQFPWELLDDRRPWAGTDVPSIKERPPAVRHGLVRQLLQTRFQERVVVPSGRPKALVIGDPRGVPMPGFSALPGAQQEALAVSELLSETHDVVALIGDQVMPEMVYKQLFAEAWDIVHIAAHGVVKTRLKSRDGVQRPMTGVVLGDGMVLSPSVLSKMPVSPSLFFLNCCHVGRVDAEAEKQAREAALTGTQPELAASLAVQLIKNGVRSVVAAGWAVDDDAAAAFSTAFYDVMLDGGGFGEAALSARVKAYEKSPQDTTWGAYQCYGEPDYTFSPGCRRTTPKHGEKDRSDIASFVSCSEAIGAAEQVRDDVNIGLERDLRQQRARVVAIENEARDRKWLGNGELRVALGEARAELGDLPEAIKHYEAAHKGADSLYKVKAIEQLANLKARRAVSSFRDASPEVRDLDAATRDITSAHKLIENLILLLGPTVERLSIAGGCWKRLAQVSAFAGAAEDALDKMARCYQQAAELVTDGQSNHVEAGHLSYPRLMALSARLIIGMRAGQSLEPIQMDLRKLATAIDAAKPEDFWQYVAAIDARMMAAMATGAIPKKDESDIVQSYLRAWKHIGSPIKLMSILEQLDFYEDTLRSGSTTSDKTRSCIVASVRQIRDELRKAAGFADV